MSQLERHSAKFVTHNAAELAAHLPHPRCAWRYREVGLSRSTIETLADRGLIEPARAEFRWRTTERLWRALPRYCDAEDPGTVAGQVRLADCHEPARTRIEADVTGAPRVNAQATISGGEVSMREVREVRGEEKLDANIEAGERREREVADDQTTLRDAVDEVGATVETTYHPSVHAAAAPGPSHLG